MNRLTLALAMILAAAPAFAATAKLTIWSKDEKGLPVIGASVTVTPAGQGAINLKSDIFGGTYCDVPTNVKVACSVKAKGFSNLNFTRLILDPDQWGVATGTMMIPRNGNSRVSEWRTGRTSAGEDPSGKDKARFNFFVKKNDGGAALAGATVKISRLNGTVYNELKTDIFGYAWSLVPEGTVMSAAVSASGYKAYTTTLAPSAAATVRSVTIRLRAQ